MTDEFERLKVDELPSFRLDGRLAVITGASDGIGRAFALAYARSGAEVVLVSRTREKLMEVQRSVEAAGGRAHVIRADVGKIDDIRSIEQGSIPARFKGRDLALVLVNCAGFGFTKARARYHRRRLGPDSGRPCQGNIFLLPIFGKSDDRARLRQDHQSEFDVVGEHGHGQECLRIAKAGVSYLTAALSTEWAPLGVRVNAIAPTSTLTENTSRSFRENEARAQRLLSRIKLGRFAEPSDLVGAAVFPGKPCLGFRHRPHAVCRWRLARGALKAVAQVQPVAARLPCSEIRTG